MNYFDPDFIGTEILHLNARSVWRSQALLNTYEVTISFSERNVTITITVQVWQNFFMIICEKGSFSDC